MASFTHLAPRLRRRENRALPGRFFRAPAWPLQHGGLRVVCFLHGGSGLAGAMFQES